MPGLSPELQEKAKRELNEKSEWRARDIDTLRQIVQSNKAIKCNTDDAFLLKFLRARKFDYDRAYDVLVNYLTIRAKTPQIFSDFNVESVEKALASNIVTVLPKKDKEGRSIVYSRIGKWEPEQFPITTLMKLENMVLEYLLQDEETQISGVLYVGDFEGFSMKQAKHLDASTAKIMTSILQDCFPMRFKGSHMVHAPALFTTVHAIISPFMKEKMASRMRLYGKDHAALHKTLSADILPQELGGTLGPVDDIATAWNAEFRLSDAYFRSLEKNTIEVLTEINKKKEDVNAASVTGTFRKLNVD